MDDKQFYTIIMRHDTSTQWAVNNPILTLGEYAVEDDTHRVKRGDGETEWNDLPYEEFGLVYLITYENLSGEVSDNEALQEALDRKLSLKVFEDVDYSVVSDINIMGEDGAIGRLTRISKNIDTAINTTDIVLIKSSDNSVQGYWSTDTNGVRLLNLRAVCTITDYEAGKKYYKDHLCFYQNRLYRAVEDFEAERDFDENHWVILASKHAEDIMYDNLSSELDADTVQGALDELKRRNDTKVTKSTEHRVVYATTSTGTQTVIPVDDLRTVDTVNGVAATDQVGKNIQIDASDINYDDDTQEPETIKEKLDQKVDKTVAGVGAKIVRDVQFNYNSETGHITLIEDKVSLEDGASDEEEVEIDVVSEQELSDEVNTLNTRITTEVSTLNGRIDAEVNDLNDRIDTEVDTLDTRITTEVGTLNTRIDNEVLTLNATISALDTKVDAQVDRLDGRVNNLTEVVANNKTDIEAKLENTKTAINNRIDAEVLTLDTRITTEVDTLDNRIDTEVNDLNDRIDTEVGTLNDRIDTEVADLTTYINAQDDLKIDKDIADNIVTLLDVSTHDSQPTIRITNKNTHSKNATYDYVHFGTAGLIKTRMADADHLIIDSTDIDTINTQQNARLTNAEDRLDAHDSSIASLFEHDVNHDRTLATHTSQIAVHETRLDTDEANIAQLQDDLETEAGARESADNALSARITSNAVAITTKADKTFATNTDNKVVGKLESDEIANNELINLKETLVSPQDGSSSVSRIKIISSDNTVIATRQQDGTIDLATNLDTDVNYFIYIGDSEDDGLSDTIGTTQTIPLSKITAVTKQGLELNDIVTDIHGVWGRVQSIDTANETADVITFNKSGDAAWGHIKGSLVNQQDLQAVIDELNATISQITSDLASQIQNYYQGNWYEVAGYYVQQKYLSFVRDDGVMLMARVMNSFVADNSQATPYESFMLDCTNGNVQLVGIPEQVGDNNPSPANWEYVSDSAITSVVSSDYQQPIVTVYRKVNGSDLYTTKFTIYNSSSTDILNVTLDNYGSFEIYPLSLGEPSEVTTDQQPEYYNDETRILEAMTLSYQIGHNWSMVKNLSINDGDNNCDVYLYTDTNDNNYSKLVIQNNSLVDLHLEAVEGPTVSLTNLPMDLGGSAQDEIIAYDWVVDENTTAAGVQGIINFTWIIAPDWQLINTFTIDNEMSSDNIAPEIEVYEDMNGVETGTMFRMYNHSTADDLDIDYVPDGMSFSLAPDGWEQFETYTIEPSYIDLSYIESNFTFNWVAAPAEGSVRVSLVDINGNSLNIASQCTAKLEYIDGGDIGPDTVGGDYFEFENLMFGETYNIIITDDNGTYNQVSTPQITISMDFEIVRVEMQEREAYYGDVMNVLNSVDEVSDSYDGLGGTEEEVNDILDEILGN